MTLLFIHGAGFTGQCFDAQVRAFPDSYAPSLPGHCVAGEGTSVQEFGGYVARYIRERQLTDVVLCGHSMGGAVALQVALDETVPLQGLVLIGSGARLRVAPAILQGMEDDFPVAAHDVAQYFFAEPLPALTGWAEGCMLTVGSRQTLLDFQACDAFNVADRLTEITLPLLAITGEADKMTPPKYAQTFVDRVPGAQARIIPGAGHFVMVERPEETNEAIGSFLSGIG